MTCRCRSPALLLSRQYFDNLIVFGKAALFKLAEDHLPVDLNVEDPSATGNEYCLGSQAALNCGRQTGGMGFVVSSGAIGDLDFHCQIPFLDECSRAQNWNQSINQALILCIYQSV